MEDHVPRHAQMGAWVLINDRWYDFTMKTDADGVAIITWDVPGKSMNVLSRAGYQQLSDTTERNA